MRHRLGPGRIQSVPYGENVNINGVDFSFHPAGHIIGSAQIRAEYKGQVWVVSGDYKLENDGVSEPFEPVKCHTFLTECTFGLPQYVWRPQDEIMSEINDWWRFAAAEGKISLLKVYALGKAQRVLQHLDESIGKVYTHSMIDNLHKVIRLQGGFPIRTTDKISGKHAITERLAGGLVLIPPMVSTASLLARVGDKASIAFCTGWSQDKEGVGFPLSDHADFPSLVSAVEATGAEKVLTYHGQTAEFAQWLGENKGLEAGEFFQNLTPTPST